MAADESDALVFFGATGDLAFRKIYPALQALIKRHRFDKPIIGVSRSAANVDALRERARELGATAELRFLDAEPGELWRRISARDRERTQASRAISVEDIEGWAAQIERPTPDELALFDPPARTEYDPRPAP